MNEAELLFTQVLNCDRLSLYRNKDSFLEASKARYISSALERRAKGEPIQYILGNTEFMGFEFKVNRNVFIPRPETEILVETALRYTQCSIPNTQYQCVNILDLCTGSGCIAVSLARLIPQVRITATDISEEALAVAVNNAELNNVADKIKFTRADLFPASDPRCRAYDIIMGNPPYVPAQTIKNLQPEVRNEPRLALDGGSDGLDFYRRIISEAPAYLKAGGFLFMEMGAAQADAIKEIFNLSKKFEIIETVLDYHNLERVIVARRHG